MSTSETGCAAAACPLPSPRRLFAGEPLRSLIVALVAGLVAGAVGARVIGSAAPPSLDVASPPSRATSPDLRRELLIELGRSVVDPARIAALVDELAMSRDEAIGAFGLARRAAAMGGDLEKAQQLGEMIAQLTDALATIKRVEGGE